MSSFDSERSTEYENDLVLDGEVNPIITQSISQILIDVIRNNKKIKVYANLLKKQKKLPFNAQYVPSISIANFLERIVQYTKVEEQTLISSLIFIDRLCNEGEIMLTEFNVHRIMFTAVLLSIKYNEDQIFNMEYYAQICGLKKEELKKLEFSFCTLVKFNFYIQQTEFERYQNYLYSGALVNFKKEFYENEKHPSYLNNNNNIQLTIKTA